MLKKVVKNGTSLAINIPIQEVKKQNIKAGDFVEVTLKKTTKPTQENLQEIDSMIDDYWDMLEYLKEK